MTDTKKPAQQLCGFLRFHAFLTYSTNVSLHFMSPYHVTFYTLSSVKNIDIKIRKKPLFYAQNNQKLHACNLLLTKQLHNNISKGA